LQDHLHGKLIAYWGADWIWGMPLIVITLSFHAFIFITMDKRLAERFGPGRPDRSGPARVIAIAVFALGAVVLLSIEAAAWAILYLGLGALPDFEVAMLYSLNAISAFGHVPFFLETHWRLLGAIEAMNGLILFGLTTAYLFSAVETVRRDRRR
jgi:hypothetical protein